MFIFKTVIMITSMTLTFVILIVTSILRNDSRLKKPRLSTIPDLSSRHGQT